MMFRDLRPLTDMQGIFSVRSDISVLELTRKFNFRFPEHLFFTESEVGEYLYIPASQKKNFESTILINKMKAAEKDGVLVARIGSGEHPEMEVLRRLIEIPSVAIDYKVLDNGVHRTYFSFHHSDLKQVSDFLLESRKSIPQLLPEYLGPAMGISRILDEAAPLEAMYFVVTSVNVPPEELGRESSLFSHPWVRRRRFLSGTLPPDFLYRIDGDIPVEFGRNFKPVSLEDHLYRSAGSNQISLFYSRRFAENFNPMFYEFNEFDGRYLNIGGFIPGDYTKTMIAIIAEAAEKFPDWGIRIASVEHVGMDSGTGTGTGPGISLD